MIWTLIQVVMTWTATNSHLDRFQKTLGNWMALYSTKFNPDWTKKWPCIVPATKYKFRSTILCDCLLSCEHQGEKDVRRHLDGKKALRYCWGSWEAAMNFSVFLTQYSSNPWKDDLSRGQGEYSTVLAHHNIPIAVSDHLTPLFKYIFPDSEVDKVYY